MGLSPIHEHKFGHNFLDSTDPKCLSNDRIETIIHVMLLCQENAIHRAELLGKANPNCASYGADCSLLSNQELLAVLLYGNEAFNETSNKNTFLAANFYINSTNRFI